MFASSIIIVIFPLLLISVIGVSVKNNENEYQFKSVPIKTFKTVRPKVISQGIYRTIVDHFTPQDPDTEDFIFQYNDEYHTPFMGPLFIYIQDLGEYTTRWIEEGLMVDIARDVGASLITSNLRYFGNNLPRENATLENLQFLTTEQILADIAFLATIAKIELNAYYSRVIVWGSGFGGTLATWARQKFPHLIEATWSSSGFFPYRPLSDSYYNALTANLYIHGTEEGCAERVENAFNQIDELIENDEGDDLQEIFNLCAPVDTHSPNAIAMFLETQIGFISEYINENHLFGLQAFCRDMNAIPDDPLNSFADWVKFIFGVSIPCFSMDFDTLIEMYSNEEWILPGYAGYLGRQLSYLYCTQLGLMQTTSEYSIFPERITNEYHQEKCELIFGDDYSFEQLYEAMIELNIQHGYVLPAATQVIYTNGLLDPFFYLGVTTAPAGSSVINIEYHGKSADLTSIEDWQSRELIAAKQEIIEFIKRYA